MTVLLVDDDLLVLRSFARLLARRGWKVEVSTGSEALASTGRYDAAVIDLRLDAGLAGADVASALRAAGRVRHVVFFSGDTDPARSARERQLGPVLAKDDLGGLVDLLSDLDVAAAS